MCACIVCVRVLYVCVYCMCACIVCVRVLYVCVYCMCACVLCTHAYVCVLCVHAYVCVLGVHAYVCVCVCDFFLIDQNDHVAAISTSLSASISYRKRYSQL